MLECSDSHLMTVLGNPRYQATREVNEMIAKMGSLQALDNQTGHFL